MMRIWKWVDSVLKNLSVWKSMEFLNHLGLRTPCSKLANFLVPILKLLTNNKDAEKHTPFNREIADQDYFCFCLKKVIFHF